MFNFLIIISNLWLIKVFEQTCNQDHAAYNWRKPAFSPEHS